MWTTYTDVKKEKGDLMETKRKTARFTTNLKAQYCLRDEKDWKECIVINMSRDGMGVAFLTRERINVGSTIQLKISAPKDQEPIYAEGILKWIMKREDDYIGGIQVTSLKRERR